MRDTRQEKRLATARAVILAMTKAMIQVMKLVMLKGKIPTILQARMMAIERELKLVKRLDMMKV